MYLYPLSRIHNTSLLNAYYGLAKGECIEYYACCIHINLSLESLYIFKKTASKTFELLKI
jgi:hypothetical protein